MATMLRHADTGEIFPYNPSLALHDKMEAYEPVPDDFKASEAAPKGRRPSKRKPKPDTADVVAVTDVETVTATDTVETDDDDLSGLDGLDDLGED